MIGAVKQFAIEFQLQMFSISQGNVTVSRLHFVRTSRNEVVHLYIYAQMGQAHYYSSGPTKIKINYYFHFILIYYKTRHLWFIQIDN